MRAVGAAFVASYAVVGLSQLGYRAVVSYEEGAACLAVGGVLRCQRHSTLVDAFVEVPAGTYRIKMYKSHFNTMIGFVEETIKMNLTTSDTIEFDVPSEVASSIHFTFDYPATHTVTSFEIKDLTGKFVKYDATYNSESESVTKVIGGENISYKRFITTGKLQGEGTYKITLSKGLDR